MELTYEDQIKKLDEKNKNAINGGGPDRIEKHKKGNRFTARERVNILLDPATFVELDRVVTRRSHKSQ